MKKLTIGTKRQAEAMQAASLFTPGGTLSILKFCAGKYNPDKIKVGVEREFPERVKAVFLKPGKDRDGPFVTLWAAVQS
jgi:hypothetical protein